MDLIIQPCLPEFVEVKKKKKKDTPSLHLNDSNVVLR